MRLVEATWNGEHWVQLSEPVWVTEFRYEVEQSSAMGVGWDGGAGMRRTLSGLTAEQLDAVGALIEKLRGSAEQPRLAAAGLPGDGS